MYRAKNINVTVSEQMQ